MLNHQDGIVVVDRFELSSGASLDHSFPIGGSTRMMVEAFASFLEDPNRSNHIFGDNLRRVPQSALGEIPPDHGHGLRPQFDKNGSGLVRDSRPRSRDFPFCKRSRTLLSFNDPLEYRTGIPFTRSRGWTDGIALPGRHLLPLRTPLMIRIPTNIRFRFEI